MDLEVIAKHFPKDWTDRDEAVTVKRASAKLRFTVRTRPLSIEPSFSGPPGNWPCRRSVPRDQGCAR